MTRLDSIIAAAQGRGPHVEPQSQKELILYRIASGKGTAVPLPAIQQGPGGRFVSDPQARICELRKLYLIDHDSFPAAGGIRHSTYMLQLNPDGTPKTKAEIFKPQDPKPAQPENLFRDLSDVKDFCSYETGGRR